MRVKIKKITRIEDEPGLLCLDDCIATIATYYGRNYELIYSDGIRIDISEDESYNSVKKYIDIFSINRIENLFKYHGIGIQIFNNDDSQNLREIIKKQIEDNQPILVHFDTYWCPWDLGFQKFSSECGHYFIITNIVEGGFTCVDPYFNIDEIKLSDDFFNKGLKNIFLTKSYEEPDTEDINIGVILKNIQDNYLSNGFEECLQVIINYFENSSREEIFSEVTKDEYLWSDHIIVLMMQVNRCLLLLTILLDFLFKKKKNEIKKDLVTDIRNITIQWKQVRKLVIKLYFIRRENDLLKISIVNKMKNISELFRKYIFNLGNENGNNYENKVCNAIEGTSGDCVKLNLKEYFNNCAFTTWENGKLGNQFADFSLIGNCFIADKNGFVISEEEQQVYDFKALYENAFDNISCSGQCINVEIRKYSKISIVGVAEFGDSIEIIDLVGERDILQLEVGFTDYILLPQNGEKVIWRGKGICKKTDNKSDMELMKEELYLMEKTYEIGFDQYINKIILPINPSIHIFAVTLM